MLEDGSVVAPGGGGQVDGLVAGEPFGQVVGANAEGSGTGDTLHKQNCLIQNG